MRVTSEDLVKAIQTLDGGDIKEQYEQIDVLAKAIDAGIKESNSLAECFQSTGEYDQTAAFMAGFFTAVEIFKAQYEATGEGIKITGE